MCPVYFYQSNGECIPTFTSFEGVYFSICLEITQTQSGELKIVLPVMISTLDEIAKSFFINYSFDVWSPVKEQEQNIMVVIINIISTDHDFNSTIHRIDFFLRNMTDIRLHTEQGMVDIGFKLTSTVDYQFVGVDKQIILGLSRIALEAYKRGTRLAMSFNKMEILREMGCYRIETESSKSVKKNKYISCLADAVPLDFSITDSYMLKGFAGKTLNPSNHILVPDAIFNVSKNDTVTNERIEDPTSSSSFGIPMPKASFNISKTVTGTNKGIRDPASPSSFGVREDSISVFAVVTLAVIQGTIEMYK